MKLLRITYIIPLSFYLTLLVWAYRYMWVATETIPDTRIGIACLGAVITSFLIIFNEIALAHNEL